MEEKTTTQKSEGSQVTEPKEKGDDTADGNNEASSELIQDAAKLMGVDLTKEKPQQTATEKDKSPPEETTEGKESVDKTETKPEEGTLEEFLSTEEPVTFNKTSKHPDLQEGDIVKNNDGSSTINAKHLIDDIGEIFGSDTKKSNLKTFFLVNKHKPEKADAIAKLAGWRSRNHLAASIEDFLEAKTQEDLDKVLEDQFPEWTRFDDISPPFKIGELKERKGAEMSGRKFPWSQGELKRAVNDYVADNKIDKEAILKNAKVMKLLEEFSAFQKNGKPLSASETLDLVTKQVDLKKAEPAKQVAVGGTHIQKKQTTGKEIPDSIQGLIKSAGGTSEEFAKFESKKNNS